MHCIWSLHSIIPSRLRKRGGCNYYPNSYGNSFCHECDKTRGAIVALIFEHRYNHIPTFIPSPKAPKAWRAPTYHHVEHVGWYMDVEMDLTVMIASLPLEIANTIVQFLEILQSILQIVVSPTWALMLKLRFNVSMLINMLYCRISSMIEKEYSITLKPIKRKEKSVLIRLTTLREKWDRFRSKIAIGSSVSFILTRVISRRFPSGCWWNSRFLRKWVQIKAHPPPR